MKQKLCLSMQLIILYLVLTSFNLKIKYYNSHTNHHLILPSYLVFCWITILSCTPHPSVIISFCIETSILKLLQQSSNDAAPLKIFLLKNCLHSFYKDSFAVVHLTSYICLFICFYNFWEITSFYLLIYCHFFIFSPK